MSGSEVPPDGRPRRVLLTGATGLLGRQVLRVFQEHDWEVRGLGHSRATQPIVKCDLVVYEEIKAQIDEFKPSILIHCAAERRPDRLEGKEEYANTINVKVPDSLAQLCRAANVWMIYMSTNYVFDGKDAPYAEDAKANPLSTYGWSKLQGEHCVLEKHPDAAILRVPLLYGPLEYLGETSVTALLDSITAKGKSPKFDDWQERFPTSSDDLAGVLEAFSAAYILRGLEAPADFAGNFHWQANQRHTKYTMALAIAKIADLPIDHFVRVDTAPAPGSAPRPQFERMLCTRIEKLLDIKSEPVGKFRTDFEELLTRYLAPFIEEEEEIPEDEEEAADAAEVSIVHSPSTKSTSSRIVRRSSQSIQDNLSKGADEGYVSEKRLSFAQRQFDCPEKMQYYQEHVSNASEAVDG